MLFDRVLCGIDGTPESEEAARQVARLAPPGSSILLLAVAEAVGAVPPGFGVVAAPILEARRELGDALEGARAALGAGHAVETELLEDAPIPTLLERARREGATLVALGSHRRSRAAGILLGSVATAMLHDAPCSVYVARRPADGPWAPRSVAVGVDGSPAARIALDAARDVAGRLGAELRAVVARGGKGVDLEAARESLAGVVTMEDERSPAEALVAAGADLLVVGSRGLHGLRALGSVSERVAHHARTSVLVVRAPAGS